MRLTFKEYEFISLKEDQFIAHAGCELHSDWANGARLLVSLTEDQASDSNVTKDHILDGVRLSFKEYQFHPIQEGRLYSTYGLQVSLAQNQALVTDVPEDLTQHIACKQAHEGWWP